MYNLCIKIGAVIMIIVIITAFIIFSPFILLGWGIDNILKNTIKDY